MPSNILPCFYTIFNALWHHQPNLIDLHDCSPTEKQKTRLVNLQAQGQVLIAEYTDNLRTAQPLAATGKSFLLRFLFGRKPKQFFIWNRSILKCEFWTFKLLMNSKSKGKQKQIISSHHCVNRNQTPLKRRKEKQSSRSWQNQWQPITCGFHPAHPRPAGKPYEWKTG